MANIDEIWFVEYIGEEEHKFWNSWLTPSLTKIWKIEKAFYLSVGIWQKNEVHAYDTTC